MNYATVYFKENFVFYFLLGLCDADESCQRFMERCLPECFHKLLNNGAVRRWGLEIQEGVFNMLDLLTNLVIVRLKHGPVPETLLKKVYTVVS